MGLLVLGGCCCGPVGGSWPEVLITLPFVLLVASPPLGIAAIALYVLATWLLLRGAVAATRWLWPAVGRAAGAAGRRAGLFLAAAARRGRARSRAKRIRAIAERGRRFRGSTWAEGERPNGAALDAVTREALEAHWLQEAEREQAAVAASGCTAWLLAAAGAPLELWRENQAAGEASAARARTCFAIASGYGHRQHGARPLPGLLRGPRLPNEPLVALGMDAARTRLWAEYRAALAAASVAQCSEPVAREALLRLVHDAQAQASLSRLIEAWVLERTPAALRPMRGACQALAPPACPGAPARAQGAAVGQQRGAAEGRPAARSQRRGAVEAATQVGGQRASEARRRRARVTPSTPAR